MVPGAYKASQPARQTLLSGTTQRAGLNRRCPPNPLTVRRFRSRSAACNQPSALQWLGRHALRISLIHQFVLVSVLISFFFVILCSLCFY
jgi:uncharacterized membrane protein